MPGLYQSLGSSLLSEPQTCCTRRFNTPLRNTNSLNTMDFYQACLCLLVAGNTGLLWSQYRKRKQTGDDSLNGEKHTVGHAAAMRSFHLTFFLPYIMAVAADWLQVRIQLPRN